MTTPLSPPQIGDVPTKAYLLALAASIAKAQAQAAVDATALVTWISSVGPDGLLKSEFTTEEASAYIAAAQLIGTYGAVFLGTAVQAEPQNSAHLLAQLIGPTLH